MRSVLSFASLTRRLPVWACLWVLAFGFHRLDAGTVTARLEPDSIAVGETATLQLIFKDMGSVAAPELPALPNCSIQHAGSSVQFVVGTEGTFRAEIHSYTLQPTTAGIIDIPAYAIEVDGQKVTTNPLRLKVGKGMELSDIGFLKVTLPKQEAYLGETMSAEVRFYFKSAPQEVAPVPTLKLDGFVINRQGERRQDNERVGADIYSVVIWRLALTAVKTGDLSAGPAELETIYNLQSRGRRRGAFDDPFFDRVFGGGGERRKLTFTSETNRIHVIAPPAAGRPPGFNGAVGRFALDITASPTNVNVGDPVTVRVRISGRGAFDGLRLPEFPANSGFQIYPGTNQFEPAEDLGLTGVKTFEQILVPERGDLKEIAWPSFSFWNPESKVYETLDVRPVPLNVRGGALVQAAPSGRLPAGGPVAVTPASPASDFRPPTLRSDATVTLRGPRITEPWFVGLFLFPGIAWAAIAGVLRWRARPRDEVRLIRDRRANEAAQALQAVGESARTRNAAAFFEALNRWLQLRLALTVGGQPGVFTSEVIDGRLSDHGLSTDTADQLRRLFAALDQARYSVEASPDRLESLQADAEAVNSVLQALNPTR